MDCVFCKIGRHQTNAIIVYEDNTVISFLDSEPINEGHILIIPKEHYLDADEMPIELLVHITEISQKIIKAIKIVYNPNGYSIMQNGGIFNDIGHYHLHIFPRYENDEFGWTYSNNTCKISVEIAKNIIDNM
ncbi:MAG: HIT family protein [Lachnospiraceae bacterium]|nr:HIT family protein [Lachnospiraceae bacterium]